MTDEYLFLQELLLESDEEFSTFNTDQQNDNSSSPFPYNLLDYETNTFTFHSLPNDITNNKSNNYIKSELSPLSLLTNHNSNTENLTVGDIYAANSSESIRNNTEFQKKKRKFNIDSAIIAAATEESLRELEVDPNSKDGKKKKRQIRNRMSAQFHRDRKNAYIEELESLVQIKNNEVVVLKEQINFLLLENDSLRKSLQNNGSILTIPSSMLQLNGKHGDFNQTNNSIIDSDSETTTSLSQVSTATIASINDSASVPNSNIYFSYNDSTSASNMKLPSISTMGSDNHNGYKVNNQSLISSANSEIQNQFRNGDVSRANRNQNLFASVPFNKYMSMVSVICICAIALINLSDNSYKNNDIQVTHRKLITSSETEAIMYEKELFSNQLIPFINSTGYDRNIENISKDIVEKNLQPIKRIVSDTDWFGNNSIQHGHLRSKLNNQTNSIQSNKNNGTNMKIMENDIPSNSALYMSTDLIPKYDTFLNSGPYSEWPSNQYKQYDFTVRSYSSIVMQQGRVLLDPSLSLSDKINQNVYSNHPSSNKPCVDQSKSTFSYVKSFLSSISTPMIFNENTRLQSKKNEISSKSILPTASLPDIASNSHQLQFHSSSSSVSKSSAVKRLESSSVASVVPIIKSISNEKDMNEMGENRHSTSNSHVIAPIVMTSIPSRLSSVLSDPIVNLKSLKNDQTNDILATKPPSTSTSKTTGFISYKTNDLVSDEIKSSQISHLFTDSNMLTIQLPPSMIQLGKTWNDDVLKNDDNNSAGFHSKNVENIMNALNLPLIKNNKDVKNNNINNNGENNETHSYSINYDASSNLSIELNCIILSAKWVHTNIQ
eukprot:gene12224-16374_t